jgi:NAD(P) transhydrogenase subunit alpha
LAAEIVFGVNAPSTGQLDGMRAGTTLVSLLNPALDPELVADLGRRPITAMAMDAVPRISRAQSLDVLSSMANIAGYRAVVEAAHVFGRFFTGQVTAAGKVPPAKVLVAGAGVAGLAAIGAAGSMGAIVYATDPRPEVADQVRSLGGEYLAVESAEVEVSATGYAKEMGEDYTARAAALYAKTVPDVDIIITTALIPGRPAPTLITAEMVASMRSGSVIVDMAAANGGNVEGVVPGQAVVTGNGVTIIGYTDLAGRLPTQASQLYGTNLVNLMKLMTPGKDGQLVLDFDDVVQRSMTVVRCVDGRGELTWPPPPVQVSAAPTTVPAVPAAAPVSPVKQPLSTQRRYTMVGVAAALLFVVAALSPTALLGHLTVFALAIVIGYYVIGHVHHALHTPLMSVTNAISGIIVVGAILQIGQGDAVITILAFVAMLLASINVFGGFAVTRRMLAMFSRS